MRYSWIYACDLLLGAERILLCLVIYSLDLTDVCFSFVYERFVR